MKMMSVTKIISAIGNNSSQAPLLVRDLGIEVPVKIYKTYNQNKENKEIAYLGTRERFIDEYATSAVWFGSIPLVNFVSDKITKKFGFNPNVNVKLYNEEEGLQGLEYNYNKFKNVKGAEEAVKDLEKVIKNKSKYKTLQGNKFLAAMALPMVLMGFVIPKVVFAITANTIAKKEALLKTKQETQKSKNPTFGNKFAGIVCNLNTVDKMAITDGGYAIGRVATARKKNERIDLAFKMAGMMYLNFVAPKQIEKLLNKVSKSIFKIDTNLDPLILSDENLKTSVLNDTFKLPKSNSAKDLLEFIDNKENANTLFVQYANKFKKITMLDCGIRDPRAYVDFTKLGEFRDDMKNFSEKLKSLKGEKLVQKCINKSRYGKTFNILANVGLSSYLLACALPEAQFAFREWFTGSKLEPGLVQDNKQ